MVIPPADAPYSVEFPIPADWIGGMSIAVLGLDATGDRLGDSIDITLAPPQSPRLL